MLASASLLFKAMACLNQPCPGPPTCRSYRVHEEFVLQEVEVSVVLDVKEEPANKM